MKLSIIFEADLSRRDFLKHAATAIAATGAIGASNSQASEHFKPSEFKCHCGCEGHDVKPELIEKLEKFRDIVGKPIKIISGYRCPDHNHKVGGAKSSQHMAGTAVDIKVDGMSVNELDSLAEKSGLWGGIGTYPRHLHVDIRKGHARWHGKDSD